MTGSFTLLYKRISQVSQHSKQANTGTRPYLAMLNLQTSTSPYLPMMKQRSPAPTSTWPTETATTGTSSYLADRNSNHWHKLLPAHDETEITGTNSYLTKRNSDHRHQIHTWPTEIVTTGTNSNLVNRNSDHWHKLLPGQHK